EARKRKFAYRGTIRFTTSSSYGSISVTRAIERKRANTVFLSNFDTVEMGNGKGIGYSIFIFRRCTFCFTNFREIGNVGRCDKLSCSVGKGREGQIDNTTTV